MRKLSIIIIIAFCLIFVPARFADEGMWTFDNPPLKKWKEKYGFEPSREWLDHVRLSTLRLSEGAGGGTGSFVSADGLVFTNQHVGAGQVAKLSTGGRDLVKEGFYAPTREEELKCPDLEVNVMVSYEEVTKRVQGAVKPEASDKDAAAQRKAEMAAIEKEETAKTGLKSEVVTLYNGGEYWLYRFKRYADVRLVFSPEEQIAYFGGDYDNFTFPRHDLDITFFRVYEDGRPAKIEHYLKWASPASGEAVGEGELVIVPGFPGSTARLLTVAQLRYHRDVGNPLQMLVWTSRSAALKAYAKRGAEQQRQASQSIRGLENSIKRLVGQQAAGKSSRLQKEGRRRCRAAEGRRLETRMAPRLRRRLDANREGLCGATRDVEADRFLESHGFKAWNNSLVLRSLRRRNSQTERSTLRGVSRQSHRGSEAQPALARADLPRNGRGGSGGLDRRGPKGARRR